MASRLVSLSSGFGPADEVEASVQIATHAAQEQAKAGEAMEEDPGEDVK